MCEYKIYNMFQNLTEKLEKSFKLLKGHGRINEINIAQTLKEVRKNSRLLEHQGVSRPQSENDKKLKDAFNNLWEASLIDGRKNLAAVEMTAYSIFKKLYLWKFISILILIN